jgi:quercetin dioxygenase-like cupin family protein
MVGAPGALYVRPDSLEWRCMKVVSTQGLPREAAVSPLFTGQVFRQVIVDPSESQSFNFSIVNFSAGSRNKFHQHTSDQILIVTEGTGVVATDAEERTVTVGDVILIPAGENHWHGAPGATPMSHITVQTKDSKTQQNEQ